MERLKNLKFINSNFQIALNMSDYSLAEKVELGFHVEKSINTNAIDFPQTIIDELPTMEELQEEMKYKGLKKDRPRC